MLKVFLLFTILTLGLTVAFGQRFGSVSSDKANIRKTPSSHGKLIAEIDRGETFTILSKRGNWYQVKTAKYSGWISSRSVSYSPSAVTGSGTGSGSGMGSGSGVGNGSGSGVDSDGAPPLTRSEASVTQGLKLLSKPRPSYTDAARSADVAGTVILRVTFLANGQIGMISPVEGLSHGLTEQAIAAAKLIKFEPARSNGVAVTVTKTVEYTFTPY